MKRLDKGISSFIRDRKLWVLRNKATGMALNVSYSIEGLKWTTNKVGKLIYFKNAFLCTGKWVGDLSPSSFVYTEVFDPKDHTSDAAQVAEYTWIKKATHLLYGYPA